MLPSSHLATPPPPVVYSVTVHPKHSDLIEFERFRQWSAPGAKRGFLFRLLFVSEDPAIGLLIVGRLYQYDVSIGALVLAALFAIIDVTQFGWKITTMPLRVKQLVQETGLSPATYTITDEALICEVQGQTEVLAWRDLGTFEGDRAIYLTRRNGGTRILPRRDFPSPAASQQFLAQCHARAETARAILPCTD